MTGGPWMPSCAATKPNCRAWATHGGGGCQDNQLPPRSACGRRAGRQGRNRTDRDHSARAGHDDLSDRVIAGGPRCLSLRSTATGSRCLRRRALAWPGDGRHPRRTDHRAKRGSADPDRGQSGVVRRNAVWWVQRPCHRKRLRSHPGGRCDEDLVSGAVSDKRSRAMLRRLYAHPTSGALVAMESRARLFPRGLAAFIGLRDQRCRTPYCDAPIRHRDHARPWAGSGGDKRGQRARTMRTMQLRQRGRRLARQTEC